MTSKHTPGPWSVSKNMQGVFGASRGNGLEPIGYVYRPAVAEHSEVVRRSNADIRLIAAAPELLEALTKAVEETEQFLFEAWMVRTCPSGDHECVQRQWLASSDHVDFCREWAEQFAVIAKATGAA